MGLKTTNYKTNNTEIILPEAYAILESMDLYKYSGVATFAIQANRESSLNIQPVEKIKVTFTWDRKENPVEAAYTEAKKIKTIEALSAYGEPYYITIKGYFADWEDDIVSD